MKKIFTLFLLISAAITTEAQRDTTSKRFIAAEGWPVYLHFMQDNFNPLHNQAIDSTTSFGGGSNSAVYGLFTLNNGHNLYAMLDTVSDEGTRNIYEINPFTGSRKLIMPSGDMFSSIDATTTGRVFGVIAGSPIAAVSGDIFEFDLAAKTKTLVANYRTYGQKPVLTYNPDDNSLYVFYSNSGSSDSLAIYDLTTNTFSPKTAISGYGNAFIGGATYYNTDTMLIVSWNGHFDYFKISTKTVVDRATINAPYNYTMDIVKINMINSATTRANCVGDSTLLIAAYLGGNYQWYKNGSILSGKTGDSLYVSSAGNYQILATLGTNKGIWSESITVSQNPKPPVALSTPQGTLICGSGSVNLTGSAGGTSQWYLNGSAISGANTSSYTATSSGIYNMIKTNSNGCKDSAAVGVAIAQYALPSVTFSLSQNSLCVNSSSFVLTGGAPSNGTYSGTGVTSGVNFDPATSGAGTFTITYNYTDANTCSNTASEVINVSLCTGIENIDSNNISYVYPNPFENQITVISNTNNSSIQIINALGQIVYSKKISNKETLELNDLASGVYSITISESDSSKTFKVVKK